MRGLRIRGLLACWVVVAAAWGVGRAQGNSASDDARKFVLRASEAMNLTAANMKPWHMRAKYQELNPDGSIRHEGVMEEWWESADRLKISYKRADFSQTLYRSGKQTYLDGDRTWLPSPEFEVSRTLLHPLPKAAALDYLNFSTKQVAVGAVKLECQLATPRVAVLTEPDISEMFCFVPTLPILRLSEDEGGSRTSLNGIATLNGHYFARQVRTFRLKDIPELNVDVELAEPMTGMDESIFTPPPGATAVPWDANFSSDVKAGHLVAQQPPEYPTIARASHIQGVVVLRGKISKEGAITHLEVVSGSSLLYGAALDAVKHWRYSPYLLDGVPVEVETTINVAFTMGRP